jgi:hypothetical protein
LGDSYGQKLGQDFFGGACDVAGKSISIQGAPVTSAVSNVGAFQQQVAHGFFVRHVGAAAIDVALDDLGQAARAVLLEAEEADRFADRVVRGRP